MVVWTLWWAIAIETDPELTELHLLVWAAQELKSEGQLPWRHYKDYLQRCSEPSEQLVQELQDMRLSKAHTLAGATENV